MVPARAGALLLHESCDREPARRSQSAALRHRRRLRACGKGNRSRNCRQRRQGRGDRLGPHPSQLHRVLRRNSSRSRRSGGDRDNPDEHDAILIFDHALIPWENVFVCRDVEKANAFGAKSGFSQRLVLHGCTRFAVKLDFLAGLLVWASEITGAKGNRFAQMQIGEVLNWRHLFWSLSDAMARSPEPWRQGTVLPNGRAGAAYRMIAPMAYARIKEIVEQTISSGLIYLNSSAEDFKSPEIRPLIDKYLRGSFGQDAHTRVKVLKLLWDAIGSEFGGRHELYERNYAGNHENIRLEAFFAAEAGGMNEELKEFVRSCMNDYDLDGWRAGESRSAAPPASHHALQADRDFVAVADQQPREREHQPEKRAENSAVDSNPVEMGPRLRFDLKADLLIRKLRQILAHHMRNLAAARFHRSPHDLIDHPAGKLMGVTRGVVKLRGEFMNRALHS